MRTATPACRCYVLNVTYPLVDAEVVRFCAGKRAVLIVEEGQPDYHRAAAEYRSAPRGRADAGCTARTCCRWPASTPAGCVLRWRRQVHRAGRAGPLLDRDQLPAALRPQQPKAAAVQAAEKQVHGRPPSFCTGCPERPIFTAMKLVERELGPHHVSCDIGCHLFSILPPFNVGATTMGYGLGWAGAAALEHHARPASAPSAFMGDGGFWHNGLTSGVGNAVFNRSDNVLVIVDNSYTAATGGQDILSSRGAEPDPRRRSHAIESAVRGVGVKWVKTVTRTYSVTQMKDTLKEALTTQEKGPKVDHRLQRMHAQPAAPREAAAAQAARKEGQRVVRERFGVDADTCTGDHSCIRLSGCPSLSVKPNPDPLRSDPVATVLDSCVGCGLCGEVAHAAVLCPSFYRAELISNPSGWDRFKSAHARRGDRLLPAPHRSAARCARRLEAAWTAEAQRRRGSQRKAIVMSCASGLCRDLRCLLFLSRPLW